MRMRHRRVRVIAAALIAVSCVGFTSGEANSGQSQMSVIAGRVIDSQTGRGVPNATVTLSTSVELTVETITGRPNATQVEPSRNSTTGLDGGFQFRDVTPGRRRLSVRATGYLTGHYGRQRADGPVMDLNVAQNQHEFGLTIKVWKAASIRGRVTDEASKPLAGREVISLRRDATLTGQEFAFINSKATGAQGEFAFTGLEPGDYILIVPSTTRTAPETFAARYSQSLKLPAAQRVGIESLRRDLGGPSTPVDPSPSVMRTATYPVGGLTGNFMRVAPGDEVDNAEIRVERSVAFKITGRVSAHGVPVADAVLRLVAPDWNTWNVAPGPVGDVARVLTDDAGQFVMPRVPPGTYMLQLIKYPTAVLNLSKDWLRLVDVPEGVITVPWSGREPREIPPATDPTLWAKRIVTVGDADVSLEVLADEGYSLAGKVEFAGRSEPPTRDKLTSLTVSLKPLDDAGRGASLVPIALVGADGRFTTPGVPAGRYLVRVPDITSRWHLAAISVGGRNYIDSPVEIAGADISGVRVVFTDVETKIEGRVQAEQAAPSVAQVVLIPADTKRWISNGGSMRSARVVMTDRNGSFRMTGLLPGDYVLGALDAAAAPDFTDANLLAALSTSGRRITVREGDARSEFLTNVVKPKR